MEACDVNILIHIIVFTVYQLHSVCGGRVQKWSSCPPGKTWDVAHDVCRGCDHFCVTRESCHGIPGCEWKVEPSPVSPHPEPSGETSSSPLTTIIPLLAIVVFAGLVVISLVLLVRRYYRRWRPWAHDSELGGQQRSSVSYTTRTDHATVTMEPWTNSQTGPGSTSPLLPNRSGHVTDIDSMAGAGVSANGGLVSSPTQEEGMNLRRSTTDVKVPTSSIATEDNNRERDTSVKFASSDTHGGSSVGQSRQMSLAERSDNTYCSHTDSSLEGHSLPSLERTEWSGGARPFQSSDVTMAHGTGHDSAAHSYGAEPYLSNSNHSTSITNSVIST